MASSMADPKFQRHAREIVERADLREHEENVAKGVPCHCRFCEFGVPAKLSGDDPIAAAFDEVRAASFRSEPAKKPKPRPRPKPY